MPADRNERYSEYLVRKQSHQEKLQAAANNIIRIMAGESQLPLTHSAQGDKRVRASIPDEDGYAGWIENTQYIGLAEVADIRPIRYVAEQHYPYAHKAGKPTYTWQFTPETDELFVNKVETTLEQPALPVSIPADAEHTGYFVRLTKDLLSAYESSDYDTGYDNAKYNFTVPELQ